MTLNGACSITSIIKKYIHDHLTGLLKVTLELSLYIFPLSRIEIL